MNIGIPDNGTGTLYRQIMRENENVSRKHALFISDPSKTDKLAASITARISPSITKPKLSKFSSQTEAYDSEIPEDHPFKGFGQELQDRLDRLLRKPNAVGVNPGELATALADKMLNEPGRSGVTRYDEAAEFKRRADSTFWRSLPLVGGPNEKVRKPLGGLYDEWLNKRRQAEQPEAIASTLRRMGKEEEAADYLREASPIATPGGLLLNIGAGAAIGGVTAGPPGAAIGALGGAAGEIFGRPLAKAMQDTEWYKAQYGPLTATREESSVAKIIGGAVVGGSVGLVKGKGALGGGIGAALGAAGMTETGTQLAIEMAPYAVAGGSFDKALTTAFLVPKAAGRAIAGSGGKAGTIAEAGAALEESKKLFSEETLAGRIANKFFDPRGKELGLNPDFVDGMKLAFSRDARRNRRVVDAMSKRLDEHLRATQSTWEEMIHPYKSEGTTAEESIYWAVNKMKKFDSEAIEDLARHPELQNNPMAAVSESAGRQRARELYTEMHGQGPSTIEDEIWTTTEAFRRKSAQSAKTVSSVLSKSQFKLSSLLSKLPADFELTPTSLPRKQMPVGVRGGWQEGGFRGDPTQVPTATMAEAVDSVAQADGIKPSEALGKVQSIAASYEEPAVREALIATTAPTETAAAFTSDTATLTTATAGAHKLSKRMQNVKKKLLADREQRLWEAGEPDTAVLRQRLTEHRAENARLGYKTLAEAETETATQQKPYSWLTEKPKQTAAAEEAPAAVAEAPAAPVKKLTKAEKEKQKLTELEQQKTAETEVIADAKKVASIGPSEVDKLMIKLASDFKSGTMPAEKALKKALDLTNPFEDPEVVAKHFADEAGAGDWLGQYDSFISHLRKIVGHKTAMAVFGVPAAMMSFFLNPTGDMPTAEAGIADSFIRGLANVKNVPEATAAFMRQVQKAGYIVAQDVPKDKFVLTAEEFQRGLHGGADTGAAWVLKNLEQFRSKVPSKEAIRHKFMSPGMVIEEATGLGKNIAANPAVFKVSYQASEYNNIRRAQKVFGNILDDAGIKSARNEVSEAMKPLMEDMYGQIEYDWRHNQVQQLKTQVERLTKKVESGKANDLDSDQITIAESTIRNHEKAMDGLKGVPDRLKKSWTPIVEKLAAEHPSVKLYLALDDTPDFVKYPFLKNLTFSSDERVALGRMREQFLHYKNRIDEIGEKTMSGAYVPYVMHPEFNAKRFVHQVGDPNAAAAYMQIYQRSPHSVPMMPDLETSVMRYASDTERRIQQMSFWKVEGWERVMNAVQDLPVLYNAFKNLRDGVRPTEMSFSNKIAQRYMEFESVKRLFLSPSATLKHLVKQTGDLVQRPTEETIEAYPSMLKMVGIRFAEANPTWRPALQKLGITAKSAQDSLMQDYFKSIVPAHGTRRFLLDAGIDLQDEVWARAKSTWGKIQDVSGAGINMAEVIDRGLSVVLGQQIATKRGMTIEQGLYGTYKMVLENNFLGREFNPAWLNNPKVKALFMFQGTPFKIFERRLVNFVRSGRVVKDLGKDIFELTKKDYADGNFDNTRRVLKDLRDLRGYVKDGEHTLSSNLFLHAALKEQDFFGSSVMSNFAKDIFLVGAATYGGGSAGLSLYHHFFHLPFLQGTTDEPTLNLNPAISAINRGVAAWKRREEGDDEFLVTKIFQRWLGSGWYAAIPDTIRKAHRISINDIPEIYQDSKYKYLFAIPSSVKN
jgi:hypothetical protein